SPGSPMSMQANTSSGPTLCGVPLTNRLQGQRKTVYEAGVGAQRQVRWTRETTPGDGTVTRNASLDSDHPTTEMMASSAPRLTLRLFGPWEARARGVLLPRLRTRKGEGILSVLALRGGAAVERGWLAGTLWPESSEPRALNNLRCTLVDLRHALGPEAD